VLALDDGAIARVLIAATRLPRDADRTALLRKFAYVAERRPPAIARRALERKPENRTISTGTRRSAAAEKQRRYRERLRRGVAYVPLPVTRLIVDYLVRRGLLARDREAADRVEIGLAAAAALERAARADR
jgi:hypothetical protein